VMDDDITTRDLIEAGYWTDGALQWREFMRDTGPGLSTIDKPSAPAKRKRKPRKLTLGQALRQAAKADMSVARVEITGDKITLVLGEPEPSEAANPWLAGLETETKQ
jgi:hypothetical protein